MDHFGPPNKFCLKIKSLLSGTHLDKQIKQRVRVREASVGRQEGLDEHRVGVHVERQALHQLFQRCALKK